MNLKERCYRHKVTIFEAILTFECSLINEGSDVPMHEVELSNVPGQFWMDALPHAATN